ncbi:MAG: S41 family peptidase [Cyclobacteriaceae bacterium]
MQKYLSISILTLLFISCNEIVLEPDLASSDPHENFEYLWRECDEKYSFFELKNIDWDDVYSRYEPRISEGMSRLELFEVLGEMLKELEDDHTNLISRFNISFFGVQNDGPDNFDFRIVTDNYLPRDYYISGPFSHDFIAGGEVGYVRFASFTGGVNEFNLSFILSRYADTKGLILDMRENGGGVVSDVYDLLSHFVDKPTVIFQSRIKNGPGRNDFSELESAIVAPSGGVNYTGKTIVLVDRGTYSAGSFTALAAKEIPNLILMGDTTGGGLGLPNGGQLPNGWTYRFSVTQTLDLVGNNFENGVPPDIYAILDKEDTSKDEVIDRAIEELLR